VAVALTDDQKAMLRLLARGEEGYEDIAALKGISVEQAKAEVREALAAAASEEEASAPPQPPPPPEPTPPPPAEPAPEAARPQPPAPPPAPAAGPKPPREARISVPPERRRFVAIAGGALGVVAVALVLIAVLGGDSGGSGSSSAAGGSGAGEPASAGNANVTQAVLRPVAGGSGKGRAIFGRVGKEEIVLQVTARNLEPAQGGRSYTVWLYRSPQVALRVGAVKVGKSGRLGAQFPIPAELLAYVASGAFKQVYLSRTSDAVYERKVAQAQKQKRLPPYTGETVLRGKIAGPIVRPGSSEGS
jgi:hypothetical protein